MNSRGFVILILVNFRRPGVGHARASREDDDASSEIFPVLLRNRQSLLPVKLSEIHLLSNANFSLVVSVAILSQGFKSFWKLKMIVKF